MAESHRDAVAATEPDRLRRVVEAFPAPAALLEGADLHYIAHSRTYHEMVGGRPLLGRPLREAVPELVEQGFLELLERVYRTGEAVHREAVPAAITGQPGPGYFDLTYQPVPGSDGGTWAVIAYVLDVTERVLAQRALAASERRYRALVEATTDMVWTTDARGQVDDLPLWRRLTGQTRDQVRGEGWLTAIHPDDRERVALAWRHAAATRSPYEAEYRLRLADGAHRWYFARAVPVYDDRGEVTEWVGLFTDVDQRRRGEEELRRSRARLEAILHAVQDGITVQDAQGRLVYANAAAARFAGFASSEEMLAATPGAFQARFEVYDEAGAPLPGERLPAQRALAGEAAPEEVVRYRVRGGEERWTLARSHAVRGPGGEIEMVVSAYSDLTTQVRQRSRLAETEVRFQTMADAAPVLIWTSGPDALCDWFNEPWLAFTGRTMEQELGNGWMEGVHPEDYPRCLEVYLSSFEARRPFRMEYRLRRHDGEYRWLLDHGVPRHGAGGEFLGFIGSCIDIHDRVEQQHQLEETTERLQETAAELELTVAELQERTAEAEWAEERSRFLAEAGRILASSLDYETTLRSVVWLAVPRIADWCTVHLAGEEEDGLRRLEVAHADPARLRFVEELETRYPPLMDERSAVVRVLRTGRSEIYPEIPPEMLAETAQDEEHLGLIRSLGLRSALVVPLAAHGRTLGVLTLISSDSGRRYNEHDLALAEEVARRGATAIHNAQLFHEAEAANHTKGEFLATMSHELRTPINAIVGYTDLLGAGVAGELSPRQADYLGRISSSSRHLITLVEDVLDMARVESGRLEVARDPASALQAVTEAAEIVAPQAREAEIDLRADGVSAALRYRGDEDRVRQILVNLIGNAVKFTPRGGTVRVEAGAAAPGEAPGGGEGEWVWFRVEDSGIGIPPERQQEIFEPFVQLEAGLTRSRGGTGLGLTISRRFARVMGGELTVWSEPGKGSAFTLWLPAA